MNDCYWGGEEDQYYYEVDTGRIIGRIEKNVSGNYDAYYTDQFANPFCGEYIDSFRARKVVEQARERTNEFWRRNREANAVKPVYEKVEEPKKTWWKFWE